MLFHFFSVSLFFYYYYFFFNFVSLFELSQWGFIWFGQMFNAYWNSNNKITQLYLLNRSGMMKTETPNTGTEKLNF